METATPEIVPPRKGASRQRLGDQLYGQIFDRIMSGEYKVGERLPSENAISKAYGVSRPVVREAMLRLRADGLVTAHQGVGTFVIHQPEVRLKSFNATDNIAFYLRAQELRHSLEGDAARLAAQRRSATQLKRIERAHDRFNQLVYEGEPVAEADLDFHLAIANASGNDLYVSVLESIMDPILGFMRMTLALTREDTRHRALLVLSEHEAIMHAIQKQDAEQARIAMQFHLNQARIRLMGMAPEH